MFPFGWGLTGWDLVTYIAREVALSVSARLPRVTVHHRRRTVLVVLILPRC